MLASRASEYGMQALVYLQENAQDGYVSVKHIATQRGISPSFLSKVVKQLVEKGLLSSQKGPGGGVRLGRPAKDIRLIDVVEAIDGLGFENRCAIGYPGCGENVPCPIHDRWGPIREEIGRMLSERSLDSLVHDMSPSDTSVRGRKDTQSSHD